MLKIHVLGHPAEDNALWVVADSGNGQTRVLLDCGAKTAQGLPFAELQATDHLVFSHGHMDHIGGFDDYFRANFDRRNKLNHIWGPAGMARIMAHRFQGYWWNHAPELDASWQVHELEENTITTTRFEACEAFAVAHAEGAQRHGSCFLQTPEISVEAVFLRHHGPCLGFILREPDKVTVRREALAARGWKGGAWLAQLKAGEVERVQVEGEEYAAEALRAELLQTERGQSVAYLTDFLLSEPELERLSPLLSGIDTLFAEAQYAPQDTDLAQKHHHTSVEQVATLAARAGVGQLQLIHLSRRYRPAQWQERLDAARQIFPATTFPVGWLNS